MAALNLRYVVGLIVNNLVQFSVLITKLQGILMLWKLNQARALSLAFGVLARRKTKIKRKLLHKQIRRMQRKDRSTWYKPGRTDLWWQNIRMGISPKECWKQFFRMDRDFFYNLLNEIDAHIKPNPLSPNFRALSSETKLALTLYYLKDKGSLSMTANSFGIAINTASVVIYEVCYVICHILGPKYIHLPKDKSEMQKIVGEFEAKFGLPQAFGCIDGTHIKIKRPVENSQDYFSYKQYFSLNVQAVCDSKGYFLDVECMWPGSVHDAKVFANSGIHKKLRDGELPILWQTLTNKTSKIPNFLIADPAYPLTTYCIKEYDSCATNEQVIFNTMLRSARNQVECAFGRLKARWAFLTKTVDLKLESVPTVIYACFVLHNVCEQKKVTVDDQSLKEQISLMKQNEEQFKNIPDPVYSYNEGEGEIVRSSLLKILKECL
jgi:hypothetical protein